MRGIYARVSGEIDCKTCGNCCRGTSPILNVQDIEGFSAGLNISPDELMEQYLIESEEERGHYEFETKPCPFLKGNLCSN